MHLHRHIGDGMPVSINLAITLRTAPSPSPFRYRPYKSLAMQVLSCTCAGCLVAICGLLLRSQALVSAARSPNFEAYDPGLESSDVSDELLPIIIILVIFLAAPSFLAIFLMIRTNPEFDNFFRDKADKFKMFVPLRLFHAQSVSLAEKTASPHDVAIEFSPDASPKDDSAHDCVGFADVEVIKCDEDGNDGMQVSQIDSDMSAEGLNAKLNVELLETKLQIELLQKQLEASKSEIQKLRIRLKDNVLPSSSASNLVNAARHSMQTAPRASQARQHKADEIAAGNLDGGFTPSSASFLRMSDAVDIDMMNDDDGVDGPSLDGSSMPASHEMLSRPIDASCHQNIMISSRASSAKVHKHSATDSRVRHAVVRNTALAARLQNLEKMVNVAADAETDFISSVASSPAAASGRLLSESRSRLLYDQA